MIMTIDGTRGDDDKGDVDISDRGDSGWVG